MQYTLGPFRIDAVHRRLIRGEQPVVMTPKVFELLLAFVERPGELLTKDTLLQMLWPDVTVEENNLTHAMAKLRKALGDSIGFTCPSHLATDPAFDALRGRPEFDVILNRARQQQGEARAVFAALGGYDVIGMSAGNELIQPAKP